MRQSWNWAAVAACLALVSTASEACAAGVAQAQRPQLTQGWVVGVHRGNGGNGQLGFLVRTSGMSNQAGLAANQNGVVPAMPNAQKFLVGPGTRFEAAQGMNLMPTNFTALRSGQRVVIESQGTQAIRVRIFPRNAYVGRARRVRPVGYPSGARRTSHTATPQIFGAAGSVGAVQGLKSTATHHHIHAASTAAHAASRKG